MASDPSPKAQLLGQYFLQNPNGSNVRNVAWQIEHRLQLVSFWDIKPGSRVLEVGCGQGDCTIVLADAVGENGHVDAVDPGAPDYGSPYTLSQAQDFISAGPLGSRINFHLGSDPIQYLKSLPKSFKPYDYIVLSHCIWYFESPTILSHIISTCDGRTKALCVAEWGLRATKIQSLPHVLTSLLVANLEAKRKIPSTGNIRTVLSPAQILANITKDGKYSLQKQEIVKSNEGLKDGYWEVWDVLRGIDETLATLRNDGVSEKEIAALIASFDTVDVSVALLEDGEREAGLKQVRSMDVWVGYFAAL